MPRLESKVPLYPVLMFCLELGNRTNAARELYMQRNTLQARIRDIESLCGIDLSDPAVIAHVRHSVVLEEYCGKGA
ncbi:MAG: helix-turn-helix domain-containing protein [Gordonibacter pamelaeae]